MKRIILAVLLPLAGLAQTFTEYGELLQVKADNSISPTNIVATFSAVAQAAAQAKSAAVQADIATQTAGEVSNMLATVTTLINGLEGVGYVRGYLLDFGTAGVEENTNVTAIIVAFNPAVSNDATYVYSDVFTFFNEAPATFPVCRWTSSLGRTNEWNEAASVSVDIVEKLVGSTLYECYRNTVRVPVGYASAFFRVFAEAVQSQTGAFLPVQNGISPGRKMPLTATFTVGTNTISFVGGIRVQAD